MKPIRRVVPGILYGPVSSRRFQGLSLGINICGAGKHCSFNCAYCFRGFNEKGLIVSSDRPSPEEVRGSLTAWLSDSSCKPAYWTLAGNGEPTEHPNFPEVVQELVQLRNARCPFVRIAVFSNGMGLVGRLNPRAREANTALGQVDCVYLKLDSAQPQTWKRLNRPVNNVAFSEWFSALLSTPPTTRCLQTMLVRGKVDNTTPKELKALHMAYQRLRPMGVKLLTINKAPADSSLHPVAQSRIAEIERMIGTRQQD